MIKQIHLAAVAALAAIGKPLSVSSESEDASDSFRVKKQYKNRAGSRNFAVKYEIKGRRAKSIRTRSNRSKASKKAKARRRAA